MECLGRPRMIFVGNGSGDVFGLLRIHKECHQPFPQTPQQRCSSSRCLHVSSKQSLNIHDTHKAVRCLGHEKLSCYVLTGCHAIVLEVFFLHFGQFQFSFVLSCMKLSC